MDGKRSGMNRGWDKSKGFVQDIFKEYAMLYDVSMRTC